MIKKIILLPLFLGVIHLYCTKNNVKDSVEIPIVFDKKYDISFLGIENLHVFDSKKYGKVAKSIGAFLGITFERFSQPREITNKDLGMVHSEEYINSLKQSETIARVVEFAHLKILPYFLLERILLIPMRKATGGTVEAAHLALKYGWAINLSGGYHHAKKGNGEGFCIFADIPLACMDTLKKNPEYKILIIDLDVHQGNGNADFIKNNQDLADQIKIFDVYNQNNRYPSDKYEKQQFIAYNHPVLRGTQDNEYLEILSKNLPNIIKNFQPNLIIYNSGTGIWDGDLIGGLSITKDGIIKRDELIFRYAIENEIPIAMVLGGGTSKESAEIIAESIKNLFAKKIIDIAKN